MLNRRGQVVGAVLFAGVCMVADSAAGQVIIEDLKIIPSDGIAGQWFGSAVDADGGLLVVGGPYDDDRGFQSGSAYVFDAATGTRVAKLLPVGDASRIRLGRSVAIDAGVVAISGFSTQFGGPGIAYLFDAVTGTLRSQLIPSDGWHGKGYGHAIAIDDHVVAVGAPYAQDSWGIEVGAVYLFDAVSGAELFRLNPANGAYQDQFGWSVAVGSGVIAVGSRLRDDRGDGSGSVYLFDRATGEQVAQVFAPDGAAGDEFGYSVAIGEGVLVVGARKDDDTGADSGSIYLFEISSGELIGKLVAKDGAPGDQLGWSVAIDSGIIAAGAPRYNSGSGIASAYLFRQTTGEQIAKAIPSNGAAAEWFGLSIGIDSGTVVIGAPLNYENGTVVGAAFVYEVNGIICRADLNTDGMLDTRDFLLYLNYWTVQDPISDWNADNTINTQDFIAYLNDWSAGC
ncbi:MAG: hypothetical protein HND58_00115 [Planctomycetota bacterium]|nr:MAG: hypothetical protein HND58_00115 [Planctomycetota bacterium]